MKNQGTPSEEAPEPRPDLKKVREATEALSQIVLIQGKRALWSDYLRTTQSGAPPTSEEFSNLQKKARQVQKARPEPHAKPERKDWPRPDSPTLGSSPEQDPEQNQTVAATANATIMFLSTQAPSPGEVSLSPKGQCHKIPVQTGAIRKRRPM
jgi:hypothetical protein